MSLTFSLADQILSAKASAKKTVSPVAYENSPGETFDTQQSYFPSASKNMDYVPSSNGTLSRMLMRPKNLKQKGSIHQVRRAFENYLDAKNLHPVNKLNCQRGLQILLENIELESQK